MRSLPLFRANVHARSLNKATHQLARTYAIMHAHAEGFKDVATMGLILVGESCYLR